jgi:NADH:ubiquinone oxidoreductase subunit H
MFNQLGNHERILIIIVTRILVTTAIRLIILYENIMLGTSDNNKYTHTHTHTHS